MMVSTLKNGGTTQAPTQGISIEEKIINLMKVDPRISQSSIAGKLEIEIHLVKYYVNKLRENGRVAREGTSQKGIWIIL